MYSPEAIDLQSPVYVGRPAGPPRHRQAPVMTLVLMGLNIVMAGAQFAAAGGQWQGASLGTDAGDWALGAKVPSLIAHGEWWRLVTASFLHGNLWHLLWNMVGLLALGRLVESFYGSLRLLVIYMAACVLGTAFSYYLTPSVSLGASTGVMGLLGAVLVHNWRYRRYLPDRLNRVYPLLLVLVVVEFVMDLVNPRVDVFGHLGGILGGMLLAALFESSLRGQVGRRDRLPLIVALPMAAGLLAYGGGGLLAALPSEVDLLKAGSATTAPAQVGYIEAALRKRPYFVEARLQLSQSLARAGRLEEATGHLRQALRESPRLARSEAGRQLRRQLQILYLSQSDAAFKANQWEKAAETAREAVELDADPELTAQAHNQLAWTLVDKLERNLDEAEKHALEANRLEPENDALIDTLAWVYFKQKRYEQALGVQLRAVRLGEKNGTTATPTVMGELYYHLAAIYEKLGSIENARQNYSRALMARGGNYSEAAAGLQRTVRNAPGSRGPGTAPPRTAPRTLPDPALERGIL